ncbi:hypothetical protein OG625_38985 [Streptomyces sp. NBC_01351]|uniref:hypothetical protein n=1 Tax=Streptomyces sp. NBC_01351 TaxID=2903833 RepID=UPI002E37917C|nr:hypothetical protein [Streptomyces sp. NBC_01351]
MNAVEIVALVLIAATAVRVFALDVVRVWRRLPGAGVRAGAAELSAGHRRPARTPHHREVLAVPAGGDEQPWGGT